MTQVTRVAAYVVCVDGGRVLLARWVGPFGPRWTLPGGGLDHGEDPFDAAAREVLEETGYTVRIDALLGIDSFHHGVLPDDPKGKDRHSVRIFYDGVVTGGELRNEVGGSTDMAAWFDLDEVGGLERTPIVEIGLELARERPALGRV